MQALRRLACLLVLVVLGLVVLGLVLLGPMAEAAGAELGDLHADLLALRAHRFQHEATRGATPRLTVIKHRLRDWVEARLAALAPDGDAEALGQSLAAALSQADILCTKDCSQDSGTLSSSLGFLSRFDLRRSPDGTTLILRTGLGILCGSDESAYLYRWEGGFWRRILQDEQTLYTKRDYRPQILTSVETAPASGGGATLTLILGVQTWCSSYWQNVYYRLWRDGSGTAPAHVLLDRQEEAYLTDVTGPVEGRLERDGFLVEFDTASIDGDRLSRHAIRRYRLAGDRVTRVGPIALGPRDFAEEWLTSPWKSSVAWSESGPQPRAALAAWHQRLHAGRIFGTFTGPSLRCGKDPGLHQIGFDFDRPKSLLGQSYYFLVRQRAPDDFTMAGVSRKTRDDCTEEDEAADARPWLLAPPQ